MMDSDGTTRRTHFNSRTHVECDMSWYGGMGYDY